MPVSRGHPRSPEETGGGFTEQQRERHEAHSRHTREEHDALVAAINRLEAAIASAAPGRIRAWAERIVPDLCDVQERLREHVESAEGPDGLFAELDLAWPTRIRRVEELRREHVRMTALAGDLVARTRRIASEEGADFSALRTRVRHLLTSLRQHQADETDLIYECFFRDIGVGD